LNVCAIASTLSRGRTLARPISRRNIAPGIFPYSTDPDNFIIRTLSALERRSYRINIGQAAGFIAIDMEDLNLLGDRRETRHKLEKLVYQDSRLRVDPHSVFLVMACGGSRKMKSGSSLVMAATRGRPTSRRTSPVDGRTQYFGP
jgi:hypothetical protein